METKNLAKNLKTLRAARGMSQEYLADESQVSLRTIQRIENNESKPTGETIKRISVALDVQIHDLIGADALLETDTLKGTLIFLKKQLSKTDKKSEIKTFKSFINILTKLKERDLNSEQISGIESYIQYLELEKIPSFSNEMFKAKLSKFKKYLKNKLHFVPENYYTTLGVSFAIPFAIGFGITSGTSLSTKIIVASAAITFMAVGIIMDMRIKKQKRAFRF